MTIISLNVTGTGFSAPPWTLPLTLAPGQSQAASVSFHPSVTGKQSGALYVGWRSGYRGRSLKISLVGTGATSGQLTSNPASINFGTTQVGTTTSVTGTLVNATTSAVTISQITVTGNAFHFGGLALPLVLNPGQGLSYSLTFAPQATGSITGNLAITSNAVNSTLNVPLSGTGSTGGQLTANPATLNFGSVQTGSHTAVSETLSNSGTAALTISQIAPIGAAYGFTGINPPVTLSPGQSFTFNVTFAPTSSGSVNGSLAVSSNAANPSLSVPLAGTGTVVSAGQLTVTPAALDFGNVTVGSSRTQMANLTASSGSVAVSSANITGSEFSVSGLSFPLNLVSGQSASFVVAFSPQASGTASANLAFVSNATNGTVSESFTGSGVSPVQHSVTLNWNASSSSTVVGYNVYRSGQSGGPYAKINPALNSGTSELDTTVQSGSTYYYVVTSVDSSGQESGYSNQTVAMVP